MLTTRNQKLTSRILPHNANPESAQQRQDTLQKNEAATRAVLIDPVLRALGWDTTNTFMVVVEKTYSKDFRADYVLLDRNNSERVIIEAKPLGSDLQLQSIETSLLSYAHVARQSNDPEATTVFLTDGITWKHYIKLEAGNLLPDATINLARDDEITCATFFVNRLDAARFWVQEEIIDSRAEQIAQLESTVSALQLELSQLKEKRASVALTKSAPQKPDVTLDPDITYCQLNDVPNLTGKKAIYLKLPDGSEIKVKNWADALYQACKFVLENDASIIIPLHDASKGKTNLLSRESDKPDKGRSREIQYNSETVYIYINYSANDCIRNADYILKKYPIHKKLVASHRP